MHLELIQPMWYFIHQFISSSGAERAL